MISQKKETLRNSYFMRFTAMCYKLNFCWELKILLFYDNMGDYDTALEFYKKALAITEKVLSLEHSSTAITYYNISILSLEFKNYTTALKYLHKAYSIFKEKLGKDHTYTNATAKMIEETKQKLQNLSTT